MAALPDRRWIAEWKATSAVTRLADLGSIVEREPIGQRLVRRAPLLGADHSGLTRRAARSAAIPSSASRTW